VRASSAAEVFPSLARATVHGPRAQFADKISVFPAKHGPSACRGCRSGCADYNPNLSQRKDRPDETSVKSTAEAWLVRSRLSLSAYRSLGAARRWRSQEKVAANYTVPFEHQWVCSIHKALKCRRRRGEIEYKFSDNVTNGPLRASDAAVRRARHTCSSLAILSRSRGPRARVANDYRSVFLMGSSGRPQEPNFARVRTTSINPTSGPGFVLIP